MQNNSKPTLVLLPGMLCDEILWGHQAAHLSDVMDIRIGDLTRADSIHQMALATLAESPQQFAMAGLSLGGIVAFEIMRLAPERVTRLALLDTTPYPMSPERAEIWEPLIETEYKESFVSLASQQLALMMHPQHRDNPVLIKSLQRMVERVGQTGLKKQLQAQINRPDSRATLPQISIPTLVLVGRDDNTCSLDLHLEMTEKIPDANLVVVKQCGHLSSLEQPEAVTSVMRWWLKSG